MYNKVDNTKVREKVYDGAVEIAELIISTLGPQGSNVVIDKGPSYYPLITNDGSTIAKSYKPNSKNSYENIGSKMIIQAAEATNSSAGDGTSTTTLLAIELMKSILHKSQDDNYNPYELIRGMKKATEAITTGLKDTSRQVTNIDSIYYIAKISSGSESIAKLVKEAYEVLGNSGVIVLDKSATADDSMEIVKGYQVGSGIISQYLTNNNTADRHESRNPKILVTSQPIAKVADILAISDTISKTNESLVIFANEISDDVIRFYIANKQALDCSIVKVGGTKSQYTEILEDIACYTGATLFDDKTIKLKDVVNISDLGTADKVESSLKYTNIINSNINEDVIAKRCESIKSRLEKHNDTPDMVNLLRKRLAMLQSGVAEIRVGASSDIELNERYLRVEDCINAVRIAISDGISLGSGLGYLIARSANSTQEVTDGVLAKCSRWYREGYTLVHSAVGKVISTVWLNSRIVRFDPSNNFDLDSDPDLILSEEISVSDEEDYQHRFELQSIVDNLFNFDEPNSTLIRDSRGNIVVKDLYEEGIIDPTRVLIDALTNAVSVASMFATMDGAIIADKEI